jgi:hypothetical protein
MDDTAVVALVVGVLAVFVTILSSATVLSYRLGASASRIDKLEASVEADRSEVRDSMRRIFEKLEVLSVLVPHRCAQLERLAALEMVSKEHGTKLASSDPIERLATIEARQQAVLQRLDTAEERLAILSRAATEAAAGQKIIRHHATTPPQPQV